MEPVRDTIALRAADLFFEGKKLSEIEETLQVSRTTLWRYLCNPEVQEHLRQRRDNSILLHHESALDYCDELQRRAEQAVCTDVKRVQLLLQIFRQRCDLLGLVPRESAVVIDDRPVVPANITFTVVGRRNYDLPNKLKLELPAAPDGQDDDTSKT
jgi:hypothetical protein